MTKEELIKNLKYTMKKHEHDRVDTFGTNISLMCKDVLDYLEQEPKWIPVSERLPKFAGVYRVTRYYPNNVMNPNYLVGACCFDGSNTWYNDNRINHERAYADNVIAWQENPEPFEPHESEEEE